MLLFLFFSFSFSFLLLKIRYSNASLRLQVFAHLCVGFKYEKFKAWKKKSTTTECIKNWEEIIAHEQKT